MTTKATVGRLTLVFSMAMFFLLGSFAATGGTPALADPEPPPCQNPNDDAIRQAVNDNLKKQLENQLPAGKYSTYLNFGVGCKNRVITLIGYALDNGEETGTMRKRVIAIAKKTACVKTVDAKLLAPGPGPGCGPTQQDCHGVCIAKGADCPPLTGQLPASSNRPARQ
jgi:hypothetical protein